jgi:hypothetical protein
MKSIIAFIVKNWLTIVIVAILLFISISGMISKCNSDRISNSIHQVEINTAIRNTIDSVAREQAKRDIHLLDSINAVREKERIKNDKKIASLEKDNIKLKKDLQVAYQEFEDSATLEQCKNVVTIQKDLILNQDTLIKEKSVKIDSYKLTLSDMNKKYDIQVQETNRKDDMYNGCQKDLGVMTEELNRQNTWWKRNEKWVYLGAGALGTFLIIK